MTERRSNRREALQLTRIGLTILIGLIVAALALPADFAPEGVPSWVLTAIEILLAIALCAAVAILYKAYKLYRNER